MWTPGTPKEHLYIAVTDPNHPGGRFVIFNLTQSKGGRKALTLQIGDHPFVTKYASDVNFGDGLIVATALVESEIGRGCARPHSPLDMVWVRRIVDAAKDHPAVSGDIQKMITLQWKP